MSVGVAALMLHADTLVLLFWWRGMAVPVILDTDIGTDIDDTWAIAMLLNSPEIDLRLLTSATHDTEHRAALAARLLQVADRNDVPVGVGVPGEAMAQQPQAEFIRDYDFASSPARIADGVGAMIDVIMQSPEPVTVVAIGPLTNIAEALRREPAITRNARFVGMHGPVYVGYKVAPEPMPEYNVFSDVESARAVFAAPWDKLITPLDTCGSIVLKGDDYQRVLAADGPVISAVVDNYRMWLETLDAPIDMLQRRSTTLYDTVAVYLAFADALCEIETLNLAIADDGATVVVDAGAAGGHPVRVATRWRDERAFYELLVQRLIAA